MKNIGGQSKLIGFFDECGDHSMDSIDAEFPLFVLSFAVVEREAYVAKILPGISSFKMRYWNHEGVNLHSRDIRKAIGPFSFLQNPVMRKQFLSELNVFMDIMPYILFIVSINKHAHKEHYGSHARNPYEIALKMTMERVLHFLKRCGESELPMIAESRGKNEDIQLERAFFELLSQGTKFIKAEEFKRLTCPLVFRDKRDNIAGLQIADLAAYPCARHILKPVQANQAHAIVKKHIYTNDGVTGWKIFP